MKALCLAAAWIFLSLNLLAAPRLGLQSWTCRNMTFEEMVDFAKDHGIERVQLYRTHVNPADEVEVNEAKLAVLRGRGIEPYSMYAAAGRSAGEDGRLFELARLYGMKFLVVEPVDQAAWPRLLALAREYGIKLAVHNHGLETTYGDPATVRALLARHGEELGVCLDVGWVTAAGFDAAEVLRAYGDRVLDLHFKDKRITGEGGAKVIEDTMPGEGQVNFAGLFKVIRESGWSGTMAIETDSKAFAADPRELVQRSKTFFRARLTGAGMALQIDWTDRQTMLPEQLPAGLSGPEAARIVSGLNALGEALQRLREAAPAGGDVDLVADVEVLWKNVRWALSYEAELVPRDVELIEQALAEGRRRADALLSGTHPWSRASGRVLRGYRSRVDGSAQLYGIVVPDNYDGRKPLRLDVVLHGSIRQTGAAMLRFTNWRPRSAGASS